MLGLPFGRIAVVAASVAPRVEVPVEQVTVLVLHLLPSGEAETAVFGKDKLASRQCRDRHAALRVSVSKVTLGHELTVSPVD